MSREEVLLLTFYGDDFTGSTDGMEALAKAGLRTVLFLQPPAPEQLERFPGVRAVGVAGVSRSLTPEEMDVELPPIFSRMRALPAPLFHVKVCSTFDSSPQIGSIGHTLEWGQRIFGSPFVPLLIGAPILNRFCLFGNLFARSGPESEVFRLDRHPTMSRHPVTPMDESDLRLHLAKQTTRRIGLVDILQIEAGDQAVEARLAQLEQEGAEAVLFDILRDAHLPIIGRALQRRASRENPLFVIGSSGVEYALAACWREEGWLPPPPVFRADPTERIVVVSGSCSPITARQIEWAVAGGFADIPLDTAQVADPDRREPLLRSVSEAAIQAARSGRSVVVHTCKGPDDPRLRQSGGASADARLSGRPLGSALGRILQAILRETDITRAVVAGGDTSGYVARELGIEALEVITPMAPGSPLCRVHAPGQPADGKEILFKGGQVGRTDLFGSVLRGAA
jgi:uncharacterized protein YgbK (DUF1537 family)